MKKNSWKKIIISFLLLSGATFVFAADTSYTLLEPEVFGGEVTQVTSFSDYANRIFSVLLTVSITLAVLMIVLGGFQYVTSASGLGKSDGKEKIKDALLGLVIILLSYLVLVTINPSLVKWDFKVDQLGDHSNTTDPATPN